MDQLRRRRAPLRAALTRAVNEAKMEFEKDEPDREVLQSKLDKLEELMPDVIVIDNKILDAMLEASCTDEELEQESLPVEEYRDRVRDMKRKLSKTINPDARPSSPSSSEYSTASGNSQHKKRTFKLPKIELKKFGGELKDWLGWWSLFKKIHEDDDLDVADKFHYLLQSMEKGTRAYELVNSYPPTAQNYPKAINALQERFGKEKLLVQVYVRDLLKIVINNSKSSEKVQLSKFHDKMESALRALESLKVTADQAALFIYPMVESSLPEETLIAWQRSPLNGADGSTFNPPRNELDFIMQFLKKEVEFEDQRALVQSGFSTLHVNKKKKDCHNKLSNQEDIPTGASLFVGQGASCVFCGKSNHRSTECYRAEKNLSWSEKSDILKKNRLCFRCMLGGHRSKDCKVKLKCNFCEESHVRSMCPTLPINQKKIERRNEVCHPNQNQATVPVTSAQNANHTCRTDVLMKTLVVRVLGPKGSKVVRLIFDEGSQQSTGGQAIIKKVGSELVGEEWARNVLFGGTLTAPRKVKSFNVKVQSLDGKHTREILMREAPTICGDIARIPVGPWMKELKRRKIWLTDFENTIVDSQDVEILIGSDYWGQLVVGKPVLLECGLVAVDTIFGWTLSGPIYGDKKSTTALMGISQVITESSVQDLWNLETIGITDPFESKSREECEEAARQHFLRTVSKSENGRYTVTLPWLDGAPEIPGNKSVAEKRLVSTTNKLRSQGQLENYDKIFSEWEKEGFIDEVKVDSDSPCHYLPHRAVIKPESQTTPVRPVFDASCKVGRSPSLNDCLEKGPNLLELIPAILLRFRKKKIGVISDVRKAFQMIQVAEKDQDYQRFLWWKNMETKEIKILRHKRVVFGVNCSPFLLGAVIEFHLKSVSGDLRLIALQLLHSLYVDNSVTSVDSHQEREDFEKACVMMMAEAGMELRQWEHSSVIKRGRQDFTTVLGLTWDKEADELFVEIPKNEPTGKMTKRLILSQIQKIFDPLGFVCPATLIPKRLLQKTWQDKKSWDEELEDSVKKEFIDWWKEVSVLEKIGIPRWAFNSENANNVQLHVFSDASKLAYAAVIFARIEGEHVIRLQHRGETGDKSVIKALSMEGLRIVCWSDSTTALAWIKRNDQWGTFVGNRVKEICSLTKAEEWRHVPGLINPADLPSRGCTPSQLLSSKWWEGPGWLKGPEEEWPLQEASPDEEEILAEKKKAAKIVLVTTVSSLPWYMEASPSFHKNVRVLAYIMRAIRNRFKKNAAVGLQEWELSEAEKFIFMEEQKVFESSVVDGLQVEQDHDGLLRVKTKILNLPDTDAFRKPVLLPKNSLVVDQLIRTEHLRNKHAGLQIMMSKLREKVWILQSRQAIKKVLSRCTVCRRFTSKKCEVPCAPLPEARVKLARVFQVIGIDLAGPLFLKTGEKVWMVLYTCAVYRAVHLEIVTQLTAEEFLLSLHRFISRRGRPSIIYTDNGTNFEGASNAINLLDWERIQQETKVTRIEWKFIVPSSPWWGGFWERLIRSCKDLLKRMLGPRKLHLKELETCMFEVEAVINSRPLTYISEDKDDLVPLTPAMFLQDNREVEFPEEMALDAQALRNQHKSLVKMREELRTRFRSEYLSLLVQRGKEKKLPDFHVGDVVLIGSDDKKRILWPMGSILELIQGRDGQIRIAKLKTQHGIWTRPLQRLYSLEVSTRDVPDVKKVKQISSQDAVRNLEKEAETRTRFGRKVKQPQRLGI
ncbi:Pro-Pol polyprotein [Folsomia candida]|uniref:Pro-Pol polyprotein n=1 Tax=Folsomia candida TaxID=158441 RepID=A0A226DTV9_FOLCA|nr:Pro-Pol polyprotein [Folsomia candida]